MKVKYKKKIYEVLQEYGDVVVLNVNGKATQVNESEVTRYGKRVENGQTGEAGTVQRKSERKGNSPSL